VYYWPESVEWAKGRKVSALQFINNETCTMHLTEATLVYRQTRMRLIVNLDIDRSHDDRRPVIDSPPFQEGTFELDLSGWPREGDQMIPSSRWKKVIRRPAESPRLGTRANDWRVHSVFGFRPLWRAK
jgi:hypothetical protein